MPHRSTPVLAVALIIGGCTGSGGGGFGLGAPDWSMPSFEMPAFEIPDVDMTRMLTDGGGRETFEPTQPASLTGPETYQVNQSVMAAFPAGWTVKFLRRKSGATGDGRVLTCGLATAMRVGDNAKWSGVYRTETDRATGETRLREIAGDGSKRLVAYSNCQALGLS